MATSTTTLARRNSSIHKIREFDLPKVALESEYEVVAVLQEGWRGRLLLVEHRLTRNEVVLKAAHKDATTRLEFFREFHYNYYLSPHRNILNAYDVAFMSGEYYLFAQEFAPFGDLTSNTSDTGIGEINSKKIACQLASALDFMHSKDLVHRDITMDNVLVFKSDFSKVKLCDFGATRKVGTLIRKKTVWLPYAPPEIVDAVQNEGYHVDTPQDVWQLGVMIYVLLTGMLPWQKADLTDPHYAEYINWKKRRTLRTPKRLSNFTARFLRLMKRMLEPKPEKRASVKEVLKYIDDKWLVRPVKRNEGDVDNQSVCYSTFSMHSSKLEKDKVLKALKDHGIETTVDRVAKRKRIHEWLEKSLHTRPQAVGIMDEENTERRITEWKKGEEGGKQEGRIGASGEVRTSLDVGNKLVGVSSSIVRKQPEMLGPAIQTRKPIKLSNMSSMNNIYDDGYQTGSSSNNSSVKAHHMQSTLAKSTGNINAINLDRILHGNSRKIPEHREGFHNTDDERHSSVSNPHVHRPSAPQPPSQNPNAYSTNFPNQIQRINQNKAQVSSNRANQVSITVGNREQGMKEATLPVNQQIRYQGQYHHHQLQQPNPNVTVMPSNSMNIPPFNQKSNTGHMSALPNQRIPPNPTMTTNPSQNYSANSNQGNSNFYSKSSPHSQCVTVITAVSPVLQENNTPRNELQRSRTDSFFVTESPGLSRNASYDSDGSVDSVIMRVGTVGAG